MTLDCRATHPMDVHCSTREREMTRFILHVGPHKTGTTYLQVIFDALRSVLNEQGVCVPSMWNATAGLPSHLKFVSALRNRDIDRLRGQIKEILVQGHKYVVITSEDLSRLSLDEIVVLGGLLDPVATQVVYYVRRWPESLPSLWQEMVKHGRTLTLPEFLMRQFSDYNGFATRDTTVLDKYSAVFGANNVKIVPYSGIVDNGGDIASHFLETFLNLPHLGLPDVGRLNVSFSILDIELIRSLNALHARAYGKPSAAVRIWYIENKDTLDIRSVMAAMQENIATVRLDEAESPLALSSREVLRRYAHSIVSPGSKEALHQPRSADIAYVDANYLLEVGFAKTLGDLYTRCRPTLPPESI